MIYSLGEVPAIVTYDTNYFQIADSDQIIEPLEKVGIPSFDCRKTWCESQPERQKSTFRIASIFQGANFVPEKLSPAYFPQITAHNASSSVEQLNQKSLVLAQVPEQPVETEIPTRGRSANLETEPNTPSDKPFRPRNIPFEQLNQSEQRAASAPSVTIQIPSAYGKSWGRASIGFGLQSSARFTDQADGVMGIGFGLGDAQRYVGLDVNLSIVDLGNFQDGGVSLKLHRRLPNDFAVAVGVKNAITFGAPDPSSASVYGVVTKMVRLQDSVEKPFSRLYFSLGVGGGQFRSESDVINQTDTVGIFGSVAARVVEPINAIAEWTGQDLTLGLSIVPFRNIPLIITPAFADVTGNAGDGSRFIFGIGYAFSF